MSDLTDDEYARAGEYVRRIAKKEARLEKLQQQIAALTRANQDWHAEVLARTDISCSCERLDGFIELYRRAPEPLKRSLTDKYRMMMRELVEGIKLLNQPYRIDFNTLPQGARPYVLAPFLGHKVGQAYPVLCFDTSKPKSGPLTYLMVGGATDLAFWKRSLPTINAWLGGYWVVQHATVNSITLTQGTPLPATLPMLDRMLSKGALFLGIDTDSGLAVNLPISDMTSGTFIPGAAGTGKSNCQHILIQSLLSNLDHFAAVYLVDGKDGVAFNRYRNAAPGKVHVLWDEPDLWTLCTDLVGIMRARNAAQREQNIDNATSDFIAVVIDEMATFTHRPYTDPKHPDNKRHAQFIDELAMLARRGRSTGLRLIVTAQEPVVDQIPASVRANCLTTIAFKLPIDAHAVAVFGQLDGLPADPRNLQRGRALIKNGMTGDIRHVQFPVIRAQP
jgi:hypothetical protein